jgi:hypothetical protein
MKAKWKGEENGNSVAVVWDTSFRAGEWVDVSHLSAASLAKLSANHFFEVEGEMKRKPGRPPKAQQEQSEQPADEA